MDIEKIQGNSIWLKVACKKWADIDPIWANFSGKWVLLDPAGVQALSGDMVLGAAGILYIRITPTQSLTLEAGTVYKLVVQVVNMVAEYCEERNEDTIAVTLASIIP